MPSYAPALYVFGLLVASTVFAVAGWNPDDCMSTDQSLPAGECGFQVRGRRHMPVRGVLAKSSSLQLKDPKRRWGCAFCEKQ